MFVILMFNSKLEKYSNPLPLQHNRYNTEKAINYIEWLVDVRMCELYNSCVIFVGITIK